MDLSTVIVRKSGVVNVKESVAAFKMQLEALMASEKTENAIFEEAAHSAFDKQPGTAIPVQALLASITTTMNATPANFKSLSDRAYAYLKNNSEGDKSTFVISKGKGGGVRRRSDIPVSA